MTAEIAITAARTGRELAGLEELLREFLDWDVGLLSAHSGKEIRAEDYLQNTLGDIDLYQSERGRIFLARDGVALVGCVFLKPLGPTTAEIKRMYVRPAWQGLGLGRRLLEALLEAASTLGYREILLDTTVYMPEAQALYRRYGFEDCAPYPETETDRTFAKYMFYMCKSL